MDDRELIEQYERAVCSVKSCIFTALENAVNELQTNEFNSLQIAAFMDINLTVASLTQLLEYKQILSKKMLASTVGTNKKLTQELAIAIKYADDMIKKILGII